MRKSVNLNTVRKNVCVDLTRVSQFHSKVVGRFVVVLLLSSHYHFLLMFPGVKFDEK